MSERRKRWIILKKVAGPSIDQEASRYEVVNVDKLTSGQTLENCILVPAGTGKNQLLESDLSALLDCFGDTDRYQCKARKNTSNVPMFTLDDETYYDMQENRKWKAKHTKGSTVPDDDIKKRGTKINAHVLEVFESVHPDQNPQERHGSPMIFSLFLDMTMRTTCVLIYRWKPDLFDIDDDKTQFKFKLIEMRLPISEDMRKFKRRLGNRNSIAPKMLKQSMRTEFSLKTQRKDDPARKTFKEVLEMIDGDVKIETMNEMEDDQQRALVYGEEHGETIYLKRIICRFKHASAKLLKEIQYTCMDTSWRPVKPYAYILAQGCYFNHSIPLGFCIGPSESSFLYADLCDYINEKSGCDRTLLNDIPVISDDGTALRKAFSGNPNHFLCHRHMMESWGANSYCAIILKKLFKASITEKRFNEEKKGIFDLIVSIHDQRKVEGANGKIISPFLNHYDQLKKMASGQDDHSKKGLKVCHWATYARLKYGVPRTSNFSESAHSHVNSRFKKASPQTRMTLQNMAIGIDAILEHCRIHMRNFKVGYKRSASDRINKLEKMGLQQQASCDCGELEWNTAIYGIPIPCRHCIADTKDVAKMLDSIPKFTFDFETGGGANIESSREDAVVIGYKKKKPKKEPLKGWKAIKHHSLFTSAKMNNRVMSFLEAVREVSVMSGHKFENCLVLMMDGLNFPSDSSRGSLANFVCTEVMRGLMLVSTISEGRSTEDNLDPDEVADSFFARTTVEFPPTSMVEIIHFPSLCEDQDYLFWTRFYSRNTPGKCVVHRFLPNIHD